MKIGDKVRRNKDRLQSGGWLHGESILTIERVEGNAHLSLFFKETDDMGWDANYFTIVDTSELTLVEQIELVKSYVGKKVRLKNVSRELVIDSWGLVGPNNHGARSQAVRCEAEKHPDKICVYVYNNVDGKSYPLSYVTEVIDAVTVKLNDSYSATVYKDVLKVDGYTFDVSVVDELVKAYESLK